MALFLRRSTTWVVDFRYDGHPRRWFRVVPEGVDPGPSLRDELRSLYEGRAVLEQLRLATPDEERHYLRGEQARTVYCPTCAGPSPR